MDHQSVWPLVDLHRHLEGSVRPEIVIELSLKHSLPLPTSDLDEFKRHIYLSEPMNNLMDVLPRFNLLRQIYLDYDICKRITIECIRDSWQEGLDYVEVRFSPVFMAELHGLEPRSVTSAVCEAWQEMDHFRPGASKLIVILSRTYGPEICEIELEAALSHRNRGVIGIDLAGDEASKPAGLFRSHFQRAEAAGLHLTAHAGEFAGSESVRETIVSLHPERIGHGVHAVDDQAVIDQILENGIAIESCPTSNYLTKSISSLQEHPLPKFLQNGICVSINTDDPTLFQGITIQHEYGVARDMMGIDPEEIERIRQNGLLAAFISDYERNNLKNRIADDKNGY
jgi:adenosine deaminase